MSRFTALWFLAGAAMCSGDDIALMNSMPEGWLERYARSERTAFLDSTTTVTTATKDTLKQSVIDALKLPMNVTLTVMDSETDAHFEVSFWMRKSLTGFESEEDRELRKCYLDQYVKKLVAQANDATSALRIADGNVGAGYVMGKVSTECYELLREPDAEFDDGISGGLIVGIVLASMFGLFIILLASYSALGCNKRKEDEPAPLK